MILLPNSGAIIRVKQGNASEVLASGLSFPTLIDFNQTGDAHVTINGVGAPASGAVVKFSGLAAKAPDAQPPAALPDTASDSHASGWNLVDTLILGLTLVAVSILLRRRISVLGVDY